MGEDDGGVEGEDDEAGDDEVGDDEMGDDEVEGEEKEDRDVGGRKAGDHYLIVPLSAGQAKSYSRRNF